MARPIFTSRRAGSVDALIALAAKQPPPAAPPPRAQRAGNDLAGNMSGDEPKPWPAGEPSALGIRYVEHKW